MASTYTTSLKIQEIGSGEQSGYWGTTTNTNWTLIEQAVAGVQSIVMSNADYTMSNLNGVSDEARNAVLVVTGTNSAIRKVIAPLNQPKTYIVSNQTTGGYAITIGASTGTYVTIPNGVTAQVYTDGTNFYSSQTGSAGDFNVNGTLTAANITDAGALSANTLSVTSTATFTASPTMPTPISSDNSTKGATTAYVTTAIAASGISGQIAMWPTASAPSGWLICDGAAVSRSTYAALYAVIGTTFGSGDGSTTFNLPNYQGRLPLGVSGSYALASTGGSADSIVVSHTHTASVTDPGHTHATSPGTPYVGTAPGGHSGGGAANPDGYTTLSISSATTGISVTNSTTGSSGTGANLPPYLAINFIIKS